MVVPSKGGNGTPSTPASTGNPIIDELAAAFGIDPSKLKGEDEYTPVLISLSMDPVKPDEAKDWYQAQQVGNTPVWQQIKKDLEPLGLKSNSDILSALNAGVDYTQNKYATVGPAGAASPFEFIMAQPPKEKSGGGPFSQTQTNVNLSSESEATQIADAAFQNQIGRMVTQPEADEFQQALNIMQRQNPTKSVTKGYSSGGSTTSTSTTSGGFDPAIFARDWARSQDDYAESFAASTFMRVLDQALSKPDVIAQQMEAIG